MMEKTINIKCTWRHSTLEYLIKKADSSQDISRAAVFAREVKAAQEVKDWIKVQKSLSELKKEKDAPEFTNLQAKYDDETAQILEEVKNNIYNQLKEAGVITKVLQIQFMVQLIQANYLKVLEEEKLIIKADNMVESIDLPEMTKIFTEMMLKDKNCEELKQIRKILVDWRNNA